MRIDISVVAGSPDDTFLDSVVRIQEPFEVKLEHNGGFLYLPKCIAVKVGEYLTVTKYSLVVSGGSEEKEENSGKA